MSAKSSTVDSPTPGGGPPSSALSARPGLMRLRRGWVKIIIGAIIVMVVVLPAVVSIWYTPHDPDALSLGSRLQPPVGLGGDAQHLFGTDHLGRDLLSRMMAGGRVSILVGSLAVLMSGVVGTLLGVIAGYRGSKVDAIVTMAGEVQLSLPSILIIIVFLAIIGPSIVTVALVLAISDWVIYSRMVRGRTMVEKAKDYIVAARALGGTDWRIIMRHVIPNVLPTLIVVATVQLGSMILLESSLSYLGLGVQRPAATWGRMVGDGQLYLRDAPWVSTIPGLAIGVIVLGVNLLGDGLRELWKME